MAETPKASLAELLKHFDEETATRLARLANAGTITTGHVQEFIRLMAALPAYRDPEALDSLLEDAEDMAEDAFRAWVDQLLKEARKG